MRIRASWLLLACLLVLAGCDSPVEVEDWWLDSPEVNDPSLFDPSYRVSTRPGLLPQDRGRPVIIAAHGYTASTFEWLEFREYAEANSDVLVSLVLLGAHGRSLDEFRGSTWREWGEPILFEYQALVAQGYTNISLAGSSTAGALMLEQLAAGRYDGQPPRQFFFIDPIVVATDKSLSMIPLLRHLVSNVVSEATEEEGAHWYTNRPTDTLAQLNNLIGRVRSQLASGIRLPVGSRAKIYKTSEDPTADPVSALLIYRGLRTADGGSVDVQMLRSRLHVFTRLRGRDPAAISDTDRRHQLEAFREMVQRVTD
jgi:carboxylesterase